MTEIADKCLTPAKTRSRLRKRCRSCGRSFALSSSGKRQKYCPECARRGMGRGRGLSTSKPLKTKGAGRAIETDLGCCVQAQILEQQDQPNPITFTTPEGRKGRVWLANSEDPKGESNGRRYSKIIGDDRHWRLNVLKAIELADEEARQRRANRSVFDKPVDLMNGTQRGRVELRQSILDLELAPPLRGFRVRLMLQDEAPAIGSGQRLVTCQFRKERVGKKIERKVVLHHAGYTATIKRDVFKELVAGNRRWRRAARSCCFPGSSLWTRLPVLWHRSASCFGCETRTSAPGRTNRHPQ